MTNEEGAGAHGDPIMVARRCGRQCGDRDESVQVASSGVVGQRPTDRRCYEMQPFPSIATLAPMTHRVGVASEVFVDESRPTNFVEGLVVAAPTRTLPTTMWYPEVANGLPDLAGGPYPLIVLAHGLTGHASDFADLASVLTARGYVVVAPDLPETAGGAIPDAFPNVVHQPADIIFILESMLAANDDLDSRYHGLIDDKKIGFGGRSLGGVTALLAVYHTHFGEPRVRAAFCAAALEYPVEGGVYDYAGKQPLLVVHGDADPVVDYAHGVGIYSNAQAPKYFLTLKGHGHVNYFDRADASFSVFSSTVLAFYDKYVKCDASAVIPVHHDDAAVRFESQVA